MIRRGPWKLKLNPDGASELYNIADDIGETRNLTAAEPQRVSALQAALEKWDKAIVSVSGSNR